MNKKVPLLDIQHEMREMKLMWNHPKGVNTDDQWMKRIDLYMNTIFKALGIEQKKCQKCNAYYPIHDVLQVTVSMSITSDFIDMCIGCVVESNRFTLFQCITCLRLFPQGLINFTFGAKTNGNTKAVATPTRCKWCVKTNRVLIVKAGA